METASVASLSVSESVAAELVVTIACAGVGCCAPASAAARDCEMKAREDGEVASESLSLEVFALPFAGVVGSAVSAGTAVDAAAAAFCAASACDCASASRKVAGGLLDCAFASAVPAAPATALVVAGLDCDGLCFERALEPGFALEEAPRESESVPEAFAWELLESLEEWVEVPDLLEPLAEAPCLPPVALVLDPVRWPESEPAPWPERVPELEPARWLELSERGPEPEPTPELESAPAPILADAPSLEPRPEPEARLAAALEAPAELALVAFEGAGLTGIERRRSSATDQSSLRPDMLGAFIGFMLLAPLERISFLALPALHGRAYGFRALGRVLPVLTLSVSLSANAGDRLILLVQRFIEPCEKGLEITGCGAVHTRFGAGREVAYITGAILLELGELFLTFRDAPLTGGERFRFAPLEVVDDFLDHLQTLTALHRPPGGLGSTSAACERAQRAPQA